MVAIELFSGIRICAIWGMVALLAMHHTAPDEAEYVEKFRHSLRGLYRDSLQPSLKGVLGILPGD